MEESKESVIQYIYEHYGKMVCYIIRRMICDQSVAMDLTHDVFVRLMSIEENIRTKNEGELRTFLIIMAQRYAIDYNRLHKRESEVLATLGEAMVMRGEANEQTPERMMISSEKYHSITSAIDRLHETYRTPLSLHVLLGYTPAEIAKILQMDIKKVYNLLYRGQRALQEIMREEEEHEKKSW